MSLLFWRTRSFQSAPPRKCYHGNSKRFTLKLLPFNKFLYISGKFTNLVELSLSLSELWAKNLKGGAKHPPPPQQDRVKLAQSREKTEKSRTLITTMENRTITKKQKSVSDKLLKFAKQRKLAKLIQFSKITVQKASQCSDLPIETTEIPESLGTIEGAFRNIEAMGTTSNQTLKRKGSEMFLTRSEEILSSDM